jgi:hypothetical protein
VVETGTGTVMERLAHAGALVQELQMLVRLRVCSKVVCSSLGTIVAS